jgi:hypothetical protein
MVEQNITLICKKYFFIFEKDKVKQTSVYTTHFGWLCESLFRVYTS